MKGDAVGFIRLEKANDWGQEYFSLPGKSLSGPFKTASFMNLAIPFKEGMRIHTRWPDGTEVILPIVFKSFHVTVGDMGHDYEMTNRVAGFELSTHGVTSWYGADVPEVWDTDLPMAPGAKP